jgi:hypothetical protein
LRLRALLFRKRLQPAVLCGHFLVAAFLREQIRVIRVVSNMLPTT